jgi:hypothetical protein
MQHIELLAMLLPDSTIKGNFFVFRRKVVQKPYIPGTNGGKRVNQQVILYRYFEDKANHVD